MTVARRSSYVVMGILALALVVRLGGAVWWQQRLGSPQAFGFPDSDSYWELGKRIAAGRPYEYGGREFRIFRAPGYPLVLAGLFRCVGGEPPVLWARGVGVVLGTLTVLAVMWWACMLFDARTGAVAGLFASLYPGAIGMSIFVLAESLFCLFMVLQLACWTRATSDGSRRVQMMWGAMAGCAAGLAVLTRPSWLLFIPLAGGVALVTGRHRCRQTLAGISLLAALCLTMLPWWVRNDRAVGQFVPTTLQVGASLYDGWNPGATGQSDMDFTQAFYAAQKAEDERMGRTWEGFEVRLDRRLRDAALAWARAHPGEVLRLMGVKFLRLWSPWPHAEEFRSFWLRMGVAAGFVPLLVLGLWGSWRWGRLGWPYVLCVLPAIYTTGLHLVFVSSIRYRQPAMLALLVLAAATVVHWFGTSQAGRSSAASRT